MSEDILKANCSLQSFFEIAVDNLQFAEDDNRGLSIVRKVRYSARRTVPAMLITAAVSFSNFRSTALRCSWVSPAWCSSRERSCNSSRCIMFCSMSSTASAMRVAGSGVIGAASAMLRSDSRGVKQPRRPRVHALFER